MGGTPSDQSGSHNSELPKGKLDPTFVGVFTAMKDTTQARLELNADGTCTYTVRIFQDAFVSTTRHKGEWGRWSRFIVLKSKSLYYGFGCGAGSSGWLEFLGSTQFLIGDFRSLSLGGLNLEPKCNRNKRFASEWGTGDDKGNSTTINCADNGTFSLCEVSDDGATEIRYRGEWFPHFKEDKGIILHASHAQKKVKPKFGEPTSPFTNESRIEASNKGKDEKRILVTEDDSDSESEGPFNQQLKEGQEVESSCTWAIWVDKVNPAQLRLVKNPQPLPPEVLEPPKKEFYLPGQGAKLNIKPIVIQEGDILYPLKGPLPIKEPAKKSVEPKEPTERPSIRLSWTGPPSSNAKPNPSPSPTPQNFIHGSQIQSNIYIPPPQANPPKIVITPKVTPPAPVQIQAAPKPKPVVQKKDDFSQQLKQLADMGFTDVELCTNILTYTGGNLQDTLDQLFAADFQ